MKRKCLKVALFSSTFVEETQSVVLDNFYNFFRKISEAKNSTEVVVFERSFQVKNSQLIPQ